MKCLSLSLRHTLDTGLLVVLLGLFLIQKPATIAASYLLGVAFVFNNYEKHSIRREVLVAILVGVCIILLPTLTLNHALTPIYYLIVSPFLFLAAYEYSVKPLGRLYTSLKNTFIIFVLFIFGGLAINWDDPEPLGAILPWSSTNGIPSYLIVLQIAYSLVYFIKFNRLPLLSSVATLVVAVFGLGRGSMIVALSILSLSILTNIFIIKSKKDIAVTRKLLMILCVPVSYLVLIYFDEISAAANLWIEGSKFAEGVLDEHRGRILRDYLEKIDAVNLIFGSNYESTSINSQYGGNPHNSFIRAHSFYGFFGLLFIFIPFIFILISNGKRSYKFVFVLLIALALVRAVSEPIFFPSVLDFFYFLYFALFFKYSKPGVKH